MHEAPDELTWSPNVTRAFVSPRTCVLHETSVRNINRDVESPCGKDGEFAVVGLLGAHEEET